MDRILLKMILLLASLTSVANTKSDTAIIKKHLTILTKTFGFRDYADLESLNRSSNYIFNQFSQFADTTYYQTYIVDGKVYKNVICSFGIKNSKRIVLGAHYDVCGKQAGADDNASGVVGLLELSRLLKNQKLKYRIDLVAYTLEEPPYFRSKYMGSYVHARYLTENKVDIYGMISLEMIGYFSDEKRSQSYPINLLKVFYGGRGNYITLVRKLNAGRFAKVFSRQFKKTKIIRTKKFVAPSALPGIDFSDHLNYWKFGVSALMITDTSFYRNRHYHQQTDVMETLDLSRMAFVIDGIFEAMIQLK